MCPVLFTILTTPPRDFDLNMSNDYQPFSNGIFFFEGTDNDLYGQFFKQMFFHLFLAAYLYCFYVFFFIDLKNNSAAIAICYKYYLYTMLHSNN